MYTKVFFLNNGKPDVRFFLSNLPYESKHDNLRVIPFDAVLSQMATVTNSICVETVSTDAAIEFYANLWSKCVNKRFFFLYRNSRYALYIVESNKQKIENGTVRVVAPLCKVLYCSPFSTLEMCFDVDTMYRYSKDVIDEIVLVKKIDAEGKDDETLAITPSTVFITTVELYQEVTQAVKNFAPVVDGLGKGKAREVIVNNADLWERVKGRVCAENSFPQKQMLPSMFYAIQNNTVVDVNAFLYYVSEQCPEQMDYCQKAISKVQKKYGSQLIALNFRQPTKG